MRIGIDTRVLSWNLTGPWRYVRNLLKHIAEIDHRNEYFLFINRNQAESIEVQGNFNKTLVKSFPDWNRLLTKLNTGISSTVLESLLKGQALDPLLGNLLIPVLLRRDRIDVFHSPYNVLPVVKMCPSLVTIHDLAFETYPREFSVQARVFHKTFTPLAARMADIIVVPSRCVKENIVRLYELPQAKIWVIHEAADEIFKPMGRKESKEEIVRKYGITDDFILFVGFARLRRNIPRLLEAFSKLKKRYRLGHKLVIVGRYDPVNTNYPKLAKELGIENEVIHFARLQDQDMPLFYNAAELFVYPSSYEGFGLPLVEAMACGTPMVVSNSQPMPEIVGNAGLFVDPLNVEQLSRAIHEVLNDEHLQSELRERSLERSQFFSWKKTAGKTIEAYQGAQKKQ
jgi:glycosyltransferase involved in cell wall biosynthesis